MKKIVSLFFQGLLYVAPIGLTIYILVIAFTIVDGFTSEWTNALFGIKIPGIGLLTLVVLITLTGYLGKTIFAKPIFHFFSLFISKLPILNSIYSAIKDIFSAFVGKDKKFNNPVLVKISENENSYKIGFITHKDLSKLGLDATMVSVYMPFSYGVMGEMRIVPIANITELNISSSETLKFALSGGLTELNEKVTQKNEHEEPPVDISNQ